MMSTPGKASENPDMRHECYKILLKENFRTTLLFKISSHNRSQALFALKSYEQHKCFSQYELVWVL